MPTRREEVIELKRGNYDKVTPHRRQYDICKAIDMTKFRVELERLERLGVPKWLIDRLRSQASDLIQDVLDISRQTPSRTE